MNLFYIHFLFIIIVLKSIILNAKVNASPTATFYRASDQEAEWIKICAEACKNFRAVFHKFIIDVNTNTWKEAYEAFTTCQWRCYRCSLKTGVAGMEAIEFISSNLHNTQSLEVINKYKRDINLSGFICRDKWIVSSELNCSKNPVEIVDSTCRS